MSSPESIQNVVSILDNSKERKICVVSAPGKLDDCPKITDLLLERKLDECLSRFSTIISGLGLTRSIMRHAEKKLASLEQTNSCDALLSFGEYMSGYTLAHLTKRIFVDARHVVFFQGEKVHIEICWDINKPVIIPGFYGFDESQKQIRVFSRGGSDISASYIAHAMRADIYENWTDVDGVYTEDPRINPHAKKIEYLRYSALEKIVKQGAQIFHLEAVQPACDGNIPIIIKNTFAPNDSGTIIF